MLFMTKSDIFLIPTDRHFPATAPNRNSSYIIICIHLIILSKITRKRRSLSAIARAAFRSKHFFSPHCAAKPSAFCRISVLIPEKGVPKKGILPCFFPFVFLVEARKAFPAKKQKESWMAWWLTRPATACAQETPPVCTCQAKTAFR